MNSLLQPQTVELKASVLLRCVGGQLKSYLNLAMGNAVKHPKLTEQVFGICNDYKGPVPMEVDRI